MCGEQFTGRWVLNHAGGSPPRVRGTERRRRRTGWRNRITPACAGNSHSRCRSLGLPEDHPRVCGEQAEKATFFVSIKGYPRVCGEQKHLHSKIQRPGGSPPRVRGTGARAGDLQIWSRITPACAGNSNADNIRKFLYTDHPRVCGEQRLSFLSSSGLRGSPPRVRGTALVVSFKFVSHGITPACAGNSISAPGSSAASGDHPRVCGEQSCGGLVSFSI